MNTFKKQICHINFKLKYEFIYLVSILYKDIKLDEGTLYITKINIININHKIEYQYT